jgi:DNA-binding beta-propeller fold protein YncE
MRSCFPFLLALIFISSMNSFARADKLVLVAGGGTETENVPATKAKLIAPFGVDFDAQDNMYLVELSGERALKVDTKGTLTILAGTGKKGNTGDNGPARQATFNGMHSLAVHPDGAIYLADTWNNRIRKIDPQTGTITPFAGTGEKAFGGDGGPALEAKFDGVFCIAFDIKGTKMVVTDLGNRRIRVIDMKTGVINTAAGNGAKGSPKDGADAKSAPLVDPRAACVDRQGNLYILERSGHALRVVDGAGKIRTIVGIGKAGNSGDGGDAHKATLNGPKHLCVDLEDNVIIADTANHVIRKYTPKDGKIVRIAGTGKKGMSGPGGNPLEVSFNEPHGVYVHPSGTLYIVDSNNGRVFRLEK